MESPNDTLQSVSSTSLSAVKLRSIREDNPVMLSKEFNPQSKFTRLLHNKNDLNSRYSMASIKTYK